MRFLPYTIACLLMLYMFGSCLGSPIVEVSCVDDPITWPLWINGTNLQICR